MEGKLADDFFGAKIEGHEDLHGDATAAVVEFLDADDSAQGFLINGTGKVGIGKCDENAKAFLIFKIFGDKVDAVEGGVLGGKNFVELGGAGFGGAHADYTGQFQASFAATFFCSRARHAPLCAQEHAVSQALSTREVPDSIGAGRWRRLGVIVG